MDPKQSLSFILFNLAVTFADDTAVVGLVTPGDETEVEDLMWWCGDRCLILSPQNPKDIVVDFKSLPPPTPPPWRWSPTSL